MSEEKEFRTLKTDESKFGTEKKETGQGELLEETFETKAKLLLKKIREKVKDPRYKIIIIIIVIILILSTVIFISTQKKEGGSMSIELNPEEKAKRENTQKAIELLEKSDVKKLSPEEIDEKIQETKEMIKNNNIKPLTDEERKKRLEELNKFNSSQ